MLRLRRKKISVLTFMCMLLLFTCPGLSLQKVKRREAFAFFAGSHLKFEFGLGSRSAILLSYNFGGMKFFQIMRGWLRTQKNFLNH